MGSFLSTKNLSSFSIIIDSKEIKCKSFSHILMKKSFSFDGVDELYKKFISDIQLQNIIEENLKKKLKEKIYGYKIYKKNFHKIYCAKYKEEDVLLDD